MTTISGTGHRSLYKAKPEVVQHVQAWLYDKFEELKPDKVISGMALGFDQMLARIAIEYGIELECALPFRGQEDKWMSWDIERYNNMLAKASNVIYITKGFDIDSYQRRNIYIGIAQNCVLKSFNGSFVLFKTHGVCI